MSQSTNPSRIPADGLTFNAGRPIGSKCRPDCKRPTPAQAHCSVCHQTFGGVHNFDRHRDDGWCLEPATLGMVQREQVWRTPMAEDVAEKFRAMRAQPTVVAATA